MTLGNMREHRPVGQPIYKEVKGGHSGSVNVDGLPDGVPVPDIAPALAGVGVRVEEREDATGLARRTVDSRLRAVMLSNWTRPALGPRCISEISPRPCAALLAV